MTVGALIESDFEREVIMTPRWMDVVKADPNLDFCGVLVVVAAEAELPLTRGKCVSISLMLDLSVIRWASAECGSQPVSKQVCESRMGIVVYISRKGRSSCSDRLAHEKLWSKV